ncbi:hypothetical protein GCM10009733_052280 [Nonomuraea maheshkhaliensis]|uniref:Uncharacterized protein n=1 Tax=Nonomuraea maheshkhaliensis TaxID=419590 RepID=A0ABP4REF0_9ACTN
MVLVDPGRPRLDVVEHQGLTVRATGDQHVEPPVRPHRAVFADPLTEEVASLGDRSHLRHVTYSNQSSRIGKAFPC